MNLIKRLKAVLLKQKPLSDEDIYGIYMEAARHMKPAGLFAVDFARALEARHGIVKKEVANEQ